MKATDAPLGVLLMGYGSPSGPADLPDYLREVMHGQVPSAAVVEEYTRRYERIGSSPQNRVVQSLRAQLETRLRRDRPGARVFLGMKHWTPRISEAIRAAASEGFTDLVAVPLSPYASIWIMQPYESGIAEGIRAAERPMRVNLRAGWHLAPSWIGYWSRAIGEELRHLPDPQRAVLLSAHSLPQRFRDLGDPYPELVRATASEVAAATGLDRWAFTFQSPGNTTEPWLGPDIVDVMSEWKGKGATTLLIASTGFVFDHLETLYDLDVVVREAAERQGIAYRRVPMPNDGVEIVEALAGRILSS
ncbi:MAG: ferrochelatase [Thermoplasmata archaeon]